jgi:hypothetical protein
MSKKDNNDPNTKPSSSPQDPFAHQMGVMFENLMGAFTTRRPAGEQTCGR